MVCDNKGHDYMQALLLWACIKIKLLSERVCSFSTQDPILTFKLVTVLPTPHKRVCQR